jgi:cytochrome bd-type quinol oxidase subunit 1
MLAFTPVTGYNVSMVVLIILGVVIAGGVIFLAISKKSSFKIRVAALGALALMTLSVVVCIIIYFRTSAKPKYFILPDTLPSEIPPPQAGGNTAMLVMLLIFLIAIFATVLVVSLKEHKKAEGKKVDDSEEAGW